MLDINLFRVEKGHDPERIRESQRKRFARVELVDEIIDLDKKWRERQFEADKLRQEVNKVNKEIAKKKMAKLEDIELMSKMKELVELKTEKEKEVNEAKEAVELRLREVGNLVHDSVPYDNNEDNNVVVRTWGTPREDAGLLSHVDLVQHLGIVDLDAGNYQTPAFRWS
jgi:seryl-tRNA synthetase